MKKIIISLLTVAIITIGVNEVSADTLTEPIDVQSVTAFENIYDQGSNVNFIFSVRYNMSQSSWYPFLKDLVKGMFKGIHILFGAFLKGKHLKKMLQI